MGSMVIVFRVIRFRLRCLELVVQGYRFKIRGSILGGSDLGVRNHD